MSNPYRVRQTRSRVDPSLTGYGVQNPWNQNAVQRPPSVDPNTVFQPPPVSSSQITPTVNDSWEWKGDNGNNGNDSWNWTIEQPESQSRPHQQQQHHQQHPKQSLPSMHGQYIPPAYHNQKQPVPPPSQDNFYKNLNGNNKSGDTPNQHGSLDRETPRTVPPPKQMDPTPQYSNYSHNQQFVSNPSHPPRPSSNSSYSGPVEQPQWPNEQHSQSLPYVSPNQIHNQKHQTSSLPPPIAVSNINWSNTDQQNVPLHNWQNNTETPTSGYWQEHTAPKQDQYPDNTASSWPQQSQHQQSQQSSSHQAQQRVPNSYQHPIQNTINNDNQSKFYNPYHDTSVSQDSWLMTNKQWPKCNSETITNVLPRQQSLPTNNTWSQSEETNAWQQSGSIQKTQWRQPKLQPGGSLEESALSDHHKGEWHPIHAPPSHFNSSTTSTTSGSLANMSSSTEQLEDRKRSLTPATSNASLNDYQTHTNTHQVGIAENNIANNVEPYNAQNNVDLDWNNDGDWNTVTDLSNSVNNLTLSLNANYSQQVDSLQSAPQPQSPHKEELQPKQINHAANDWNRQTATGLKSDNVENTPDNVPVLNVEHNQLESVTGISQELFEPQTSPGSKSTENVTQASYDQWYKQNVRAQPENEFFSSQTTKQWQQQPEQNVENYENIQQGTEFVNLEVVAPEMQERDIYGSRDSINKETLDNDQGLRQSNTLKESVHRGFRQEQNNIEVPVVQQIQQPFQTEQAPDNYEFASNDRNTFLETGELTDPHSQEPAQVPPSQDDENDEVPNDIPFLREVPGQSSNVDPRRNDPTGQEQYPQSVVVPRMPDPRRNDPSGQEQQQHVTRSNLLADRMTDRRDMPSGQERAKPIQSPPPQRNAELETVERRNDPSGRERSLPPLPPPQQSRNEPSGEEQRITLSITQPTPLESSAVREIPGRGNESEETIQQQDIDIRQIPGGASSNESVQNISDDRSGARVVTGSQQVNVPSSLSTTQDLTVDNRSKREEAVGASIVETQISAGMPNRRDSYEDGDDEGSGNSRDDSRDRHREPSPKPRHPRYDYNRKHTYYDRDREFDDDYGYGRRGADYDRSYYEDLGRRDSSFRDDDRRHASRDDLDRNERDRDRHSREDHDRRGRIKPDELEDRDCRRRLEERRRDRSADPRHVERSSREYDPRYPKDLRERDYHEREGRRRDGRGRRYPEYDSRESFSSRPSSRSSYNERERDHYYMRPRESYSYGFSNYSSYEYGPNYNSDYYAYLENLRRTNPVAYAEWYHKYMQHQQLSRNPVANYPEDRASVHSGRSSCEDRNSSEKRNLTDVSLLEDQTTASSRMTPTKFSTAHTKGTFSIGALIHVHPSYPTDGERARIDLLKIDELFHQDSTFRELRSYPGPLIKGVTHKKTIIEYCENKIKKAPLNEEIFEVSSYVLLYELMIMLIQQNGNVVGVDIASLLLRNKEAYPYEATKPMKEPIRRESTISERSGASGSDRGITADTVQSLEKEEVKPRKTVEQLTDEFRNTLLYGLVREALEFAMVEGLWGHALFLASKLDKRTHASVMTRFANSLPTQDPLQTLYQLHSGRVPASVTCISDARWDDWRPHLAMIISNTSANPEINRRAISTLGDTLASRGDVYAAHFCYILSQVDFGAYGQSNVKLVLIGANHHKPYSDFISTDAIMLTEIYEYARKLSEPFTLIELQTFEFNNAIKMVDYGLVEKALLYIEQVATNIVSEPEKYKQSFIKDVYLLGDRLKYHDPVCKDSCEDAVNLPWLNKLANIVDKCATGEIIENNFHATNTVAQGTIESTEYQQSKWSDDYSVVNSNVPVHVNPNVEWQINQQTTSVPHSYGLAAEPQYNDEPANDVQMHYQNYQDYWIQQQQQQQSYDQEDYSQHTSLQYGAEQHEEHNEHQNNWAFKSSDEKSSAVVAVTKAEAAAPLANSTASPVEQQQPQQLPPQPNVSMGPTAKKQYDPLEELEQIEPSKFGPGKPASEGKKPQDKSQEKKATNGGSWFGGLFSKLAIKPKNQMILPDDSNPAIVWDPIQKKWMNKDEDENNSAPLAPPPKMADLPGFKSADSMNQSVAPPAIPATVSTLPATNVITAIGADETLGLNGTKLIAGGGGNMYKMNPRGRKVRTNYVDVLNPGSVKSSNTSSRPIPASSPPVPMAASSPQFFTPTPVNDPNAPVDFLTPAPTAVSQSNENAQALSRWSSTSSLSREVQSYTMRDPRLLQRDKGPMMYNPVELKDRSTKAQARSRYPPR
ncbi:uncharacterized protein LOC131670805 isoform X2 [Phymastichus coffea]|uniref:uncharacterized protein LOC131670805 isoform X2 n=1 Tax=Phymastichus coffea TaxID=108790 RepID=UPI00273AB821|nr:uncharacterized protein LOC131670805 isoform X2 [Phymastichus coffea]